MEMRGRMHGCLGTCLTDPTLVSQENQEEQREFRRSQEKLGEEPEPGGTREARGWEDAWMEMRGRMRGRMDGRMNGDAWEDGMDGWTCVDGPLAVPGSAWHLLAPPGSSLLFLARLGYSWFLLAPSSFS
jgi:hypothetical protein